MQFKTIGILPLELKVKKPANIRFGGEIKPKLTGDLLALKRQLNLVEICKSLDEKGLTKNEAYPLWIW